MKNFVYCLLFLACVFSLSSCERQVKKSLPEGIEREKRSCDVTDFERIEVNAFCDVKFVQDGLTRVVIEGRKKDLDRLSVQVKDETLVIGYDEKKTGSHRRDVGGYKRVRVLVSSPDLIALNMKAAGSIETEGLLDTDTLDVVVHGAGNVEFERVVCDVLQLQLQGAGNVEFDKLTAQHSNISLRGVGNIDVDFENSGTADCRLDGVGNIGLKGTLNQLKKDVRGVGRIDTNGLKETQP